MIKKKPHLHRALHLAANKDDCGQILQLTNSQAKCARGGYHHLAVMRDLEPAFAAPGSCPRLLFRTFHLSAKNITFKFAAQSKDAVRARARHAAAAEETPSSVQECDLEMGGQRWPATEQKRYPAWRTVMALRPEISKPGMKHLSRMEQSQTAPTHPVAGAGRLQSSISRKQKKGYSWHALF